MFVKTDMKPFENKIWLASPTMHGEEMKYINEAYESNWMSTVGANINEVERIAAEKAEMKYAVALSCCTAALHLCCKFAGEKLYGKPAISHGALEGKRVFCSDMTFDATLNPVVYEGCIPVFIDTEESRDGVPIMFFSLDEPRILVGKKKALVESMAEQDEESVKHFISCNRNDYPKDNACDVAYPEAWGEAKHGLNYLQRQRRDRIIENVSKKDIYIKGRKMVNPLIGIIPSREEIENELSDLLMSM